MFEIRIFIDYKQGWRALRPTNGEPYKFETKEEAVKVANICYPDNFRDNIKIQEI